MIKYNTPQELFTAICDKIRDKIGSNELINHQDIPDKIDNLVDSDIINEYNKLLSMIINQNTIIELNNNEIENINICFRECASLTTVDLPKCATINSHTFQDCTNLTTIDLPECTSIGEHAFSGCTSLTTVNLPECTSIGEYAFWDCTHLITANLPKCTSIGDKAFGGCTNLTTIDLLECTTLGYSAFIGCTGLTTMILSNNQVVTLDRYAFYNTPIANGTGYVYVPDNLVDSYKTDNDWSSYANQIKPLSELPSNLKEEYGYE